MDGGQSKTGEGAGRPAGPLGFRLPFDLETGELMESRWRRGLRHDSIHLVDRYARNLRALRGVCIDCGWRDQRRITLWKPDPVAARRRGAHPPPHEFDDDHSDIDDRMDVGPAFLARLLTA